MSKRGHIAGAIIERGEKEEQSNAKLGFSVKQQINYSGNRDKMAQERLLAPNPLGSRNVFKRSCSNTKACGVLIGCRKKRKGNQKH